MRRLASRRARRRCRTTVVRRGAPVEATARTARLACASCSGTATSSGAPARTSTRAMLAREWSRAGHEVTVLSQEPHPERYDLGGAAAVRPDVGGLLPVFVLDRYEGYDVRRLQDCTRAELDGWVEANAAAIRALLPADVVFTNHVLLGGPVARRPARRFAVKAHGSELEYSMRGNAELAAWGRRGPRQRTRRRSSARSTSAASLEEVCGHVERVTRCRRASTSTSGFRSRAPRRSPALVEEARRDPPEPGQRRGAAPRRGQRRAVRELPRGRPADRRLLRQAHRAEGRPRPDRGAARDRGASRGRRLRPERAALEAGWRPGGDAVHRAARAPAPPSICCRSRTGASSRRSSPRRSGWSQPRRPPPAVRRSSRATRGSPRSPPASRTRTRPSCAQLASFDDR